MKIIIAGSRGFCDFDLLRKTLDEILIPESSMEIVSGTAKGADRMGEDYAFERHIQVKRFPADWSKHGKSAGYIRNEEMAKYADMLIAFWDGVSKGTGMMIDLATRNGLKVTVIEY